MIDRLSWRPFNRASIVKAKAKKNIDDFSFTELNGLRVSSIYFDDPTLILTDKYLDNYWKIAIYLTILHQSPEIDIKEFNTFKKKAVKFKVQDKHFFFKIVKIYWCIKLLIILCSGGLFLINYTIKTIIMNGKIPIN